MKNNNTILLGGKLLAKNSLYSFIGMILPMIAGLIAIPFLLTEMGENLFGLLILFWSTISYITMLDFGLNRAATKYFAQNIGILNEQDNLNLLATSIVFVVSIGFLAGSVLFFGSEFLVSQLFEESSEISSIAVDCFKLISYYSPVLLLIPTLSAFLRSYQNFKWLSIINSINGILNYVIPIIALIGSYNLYEIINALLIVKVIILVALVAASFKFIKVSKFSFLELDLTQNIKKLITFGGWVSISNFLAPLFDYTDRFVIASYITVSAVAIYGTPLEIVLKVGMIAMAISSVLFAAISNSIEHDLVKTEKIINKSLSLVTLLTYPMILTLTLFAEEGLTLWVGSAIAIEGAIVLQIVGIGILFKCSTNISIAYLHSINKPKTTAKVHVFEFVFYLAGLIALVKLFGLKGAAIAHTVRLVLDNLLMGYLAQKNSKNMNLTFIKNTKVIMLLVVSISPAFLETSLYLKLCWWVISMIFYSVYLSRNFNNYKRLLYK